MKRFLSLPAILALACTSTVAPRTPADDCLFVEPPRFIDSSEDTYGAAVASVFSGEWGHVGSCFNAALLSEGKVEEFVFSECPLRGEAVVVHLVAAESIAEKLRSDGFEAARRVAIHRSEALIPAADASRLRDLWLQLLHTAKVETGTRLREPRGDYFLSALRPGTFQGRLSGIAKNPRPDTPAARLVEIGRMLGALADAPQASRAMYLRQIAERASSLSREVGALDDHR